MEERSGTAVFRCVAIPRQRETFVAVKSYSDLLPNYTVPKESPNVGTGNGNRILRKSSMCP